MPPRTALPPVHLTTEELAARLHKTPVAVRIMHSRGTGPGGSFRVGNTRLYPIAEVEAWEQRLARSA